MHLDILESVREQEKMIFFTRLSPNDGLKGEFYSVPNSITRDIHFYCDNLILRLFSVHFYAFYLNRHKNVHVFSSNSTFFYDMLPFLSKKLIKSELLHNFTLGNNGMEFFGLANHQYLDNRMVIDAATMKNIKEQYETCGVPHMYLGCLKLIEPGVFIPENRKKETVLPIKILYAGRGGAQKRIFLLDRIARQCLDEKLPVTFHFAGTMMNELSDYVKTNSTIHGEISGVKQMYSLYEQCDVILMTSAYEGFPMLIKEGMACSCIPLVTALEGNKTHLQSGENALLITNIEDENALVAEAMSHIKSLILDSALRIQICANA